MCYDKGEFASSNDVDGDVTKERSIEALSWAFFAFFYKKNLKWKINKWNFVKFD